MSLIQNNSAVHKEWLAKQRRDNNNKKDGAAAGFEYAVQPDGSCFAEQQWQRQAQIRGPTFVSTSSSSDRRLYQSINDLEPSHQAGVRRRSQERQQAAALIRPSPPEQVTLSTMQEPQHPDGPAFLSPTRRLRNRHNAVYGTHLPNATNAPACAQKVFGASSAQKEERRHCQALLHNNAAATTSTNDSIMETDPVDDSLFAAMDLEQLVAQRQQQQQQQTQSTTSEVPFDYGNSDWDSFSARTNHTNIPTAAGRISSPTTIASNESSFFQGRDSNASFDSASFQNNGHSSFDAGSSRASTGTFTNDTRESYSSYAITTREASFASGSNQGGSFMPANSFTNSNTFDNDNYNGSFAQHAILDTSSSADGIPLCPGHNLACRVNTANTTANMGRQFYKCCLPEGQQCDFFQWADGIEGNLNPPLGQYGSTGIIKDIWRENRRIFGHHSFRKGQEEVIQHAVQGRDVFVLMPTGGGKSLCYQLPACCCPGLAVIISPLLSLIQDQVASLKKNGVRAEFLNSSQDYETQQRQIEQELYNMGDHDGIKLLYITPERLSGSKRMRSLLQRLYSRNLISRFVVDEAHCLSDWGK
jgi:hypothetical protein